MATEKSKNVEVLNSSSLKLIFLVCFLIAEKDLSGFFIILKLRCTGIRSIAPSAFTLS